MHTVVVGAGAAGLAAAQALRAAGTTTTLLEAGDDWGGHCRTSRFAGCLFDEGPHLSFTDDADVRAFFDAGPAAGWHRLDARIACHDAGRWVTHPPQVHLHGEDPRFVARVLQEMADRPAPGTPTETYAEWLDHAYGPTFAHRYPHRYTRKYWTVGPERLGVDWVGRRMYRPSVEEVALGALLPRHEGEFHYLSTYRYPLDGGFQQFLAGVAAAAGPVATGAEVVAVMPRGRALRLGDGRTVAYDHLVSTLPLDVLVGLLRDVDVPTDVTRAVDELLCTSVALVDVVADRRLDTPADWFYVYDEDLLSTRVHFPSALAPMMSPEGVTTMQVEVYTSKERPVPREDLSARVVDELVTMGVLPSPGAVRARRTVWREHANVVFTLGRARALDVVQGFLDDLGVVRAGRFGDWEYHWSDGAVRSGWRAAATVLGQDVGEVVARCRRPGGPTADGLTAAAP